MIAAVDQLMRAVAKGTDQTPAPSWAYALIVVGFVIVLVMWFIIIAFFKTWIRAYAAGTPVSFGTLIGMRLRKVPASLIVEALIIAHKAGVGDVTVEKLELHYLAGGNVIQVVRALAAARKVNMELTFEHAAAIDLAGRDVFAEVQQAVRASSLPGA